VALQDIRLLLVRPRDHVVASVRLVGFRVDGDSVTASDGPGLVEIGLPPQATGELPYDAGVGLADARLGGPSRVTFRVEQQTTAPLSADGILAMAAGGVPVAEPAEPGLEPTSVELPWRFGFSPRPRVANDVLLAALPLSPLVGPGGAAGLWHLRLEAASGLAIVPLEGDAGDVDEVGLGFAPPLHRQQRDRIRAEGAPPQDPPTAPYVDLSPLGGTMSVKGTWERFAWEQEVVLGRDMVVKTETKGILYPWGHRAILIDATRRVLVPEAGPATAGLQQLRVLLVPDPVRRRAQDGPLARALPFDEVEILQPFTEVGPVNPADPQVTRRRPPKRLEQLDADEDSLEAARNAQNDLVTGLPARREAEINGNAQLASESRSARLAEIDPTITFLSEIDRVFQEWAAANPPPPPDTDPPEMIIEGEHGSVVVETPVPASDPGPPSLTDDQARQLRELSAEAQRLTDELAQIEATRLADLAAVPQTEDGLLLLGGEYEQIVTRARQLRTEFDTFAAFVADVHRQADQDLAVFEWPQAKTGGRLMLPVRCDGLRTTTPVLFVHDQHFDENDDFPEFAPLRDPAVLAEIATAWTGNQARRLPIAGIPVDLVRNGPTQPADVLPVHELTIGGRQDGTEFRAVIDEAKVALKAVAQLVPNLDGMARVQFDPKFIEEGIADKVALRLPDSLGVDFRRATDKAGGLISPVFSADVLSRVDGPVDARALPGLLPGPPNLAAAFADATIMGIPLASIVDDVSLPEPLSIVVEPDGSTRMSWKDVALKSDGPFVAGPGPTKLHMTVVRSPEETKIECRIENFKLVLPPGGDLVQLHFKALTFVQKPGSAPDLKVEGFKFELGGDLSLLKTLQEKVDFGSAAPTVRSAPNGMRAGYTLAVPEVTAGMFVMRNIAASAGVEVPFDGEPIVTSLAFASREDPFHLSVSIFGGSGYLLFEIAEEGIRKLEASLDFGASVAISVGVASAEVHALGGVRFLLAGNEVKVTGFLRVGGSVDVLGLVSVSVELRVELSYDGRVLSGRATAVIEIDVTFWSGSVNLDSGEYVFAGAAHPGPPPAAAVVQTHEPSLNDWQKYRDKFGAA
jgi:hypothetical protein